MQSIINLFNSLPAVIQAAVVILGALSLIATTLSGIFKLFGWSKGVALMAALGADFAKAVAVLQGFLPNNKAIKATIVSFITLALLSGCGFLGIGTKSPCDGLYCLSVTGQGVPGEALVCYSTQAQMLDAQQQYRAKGAKAEVAK